MLRNATTQCSYLLLASVYFGLLAGRSRAGKSVESVAAVFRRRGLRYLALALVDVEAAYLMQRAMQLTTLVSVQVGGAPLSTGFNPEKPLL